MRFSLKSSPVPRLFEFDDEIQRGPFDRGLGGFSLCDAISGIYHVRDRAYDTNRKSYMGYRLQQKSMTLNDYRFSLFCRQAIIIRF